MSRSSQARRKPNLKKIMLVGTGVCIGSGIGLIAGITMAGVIVSASKLVALGVVPKITGIIGGALGLRWSLRKTSKKK